MAEGFRDRRYRQLIEALVAERKRLGISQDQLAQQLRWHQQGVSRFETGERRLDVVEFLDIARCLKLDPAELVSAVPEQDRK